MKISETQAIQIYEEACCAERRLTSRQATQLIWGTSRMQRRVLHLLQTAKKKQAKRDRAKRGKNVRPFMRLTPAGFVQNKTEKELFKLLVQFGEDTETYEPEAVQRAMEETERREDEWDDFLYEESLDNYDAELVLFDDAYDEDSVCDNDNSDYDFGDL